MTQPTQPKAEAVRGTIRVDCSYLDHLKFGAYIETYTDSAEVDKATAERLAACWNAFESNRSIDPAAVDVGELVAALKWYANDQNYHTGKMMPTEHVSVMLEYQTESDRDHGKRARAALSKAKVTP